MPRFAANISMMFTDRPLLDRIDASAAAGFPAIECSNPYEASGEAFAARVKKANIQVALLNLPAGNWGAGERGIACHASRVADFKASIEEGIDFARLCGATRMNCLAGIVPAGVDAATARSTLIDNLKIAAPKMQAAGIALLVEPINNYDLPGFAINRSKEAMDVIDAVGSDNVYLQYDVYHMQRMEGELGATIERLINRIGHVQVADNPGRHEPGTGEINYRYVLDLLDRLGYEGWTGCEYAPLGRTEDGLGWLDAYKA